MSQRTEALPSRTATGDDPRHVLVPFDGYERAERALNYACAEFPRDDVVALHAVTREDDAGSRAWVDSPEQFRE